MNNWNIKISEVGSPMVGFNISIDNNGEVVSASKTLYKSFNRAIDDAQKIINNRIDYFRLRNKRVSSVNDLFIKKFIRSGLYNGVYNSLVKFNSKGSPYLEVSMNTDNENLVKLIPNSITDPNTKIDFNIVKVNKPTVNSNPNTIV